MALRRKNKRTERSKLDATPPWEQRHRDEPEPTEGPYDERDAPDDERERVDLGALRVPVFEGLDLRLEINDAQQVVAVTLAVPDGHMQLGVFAAPRNEGLWDEVRAELANSMTSQRGAPQEHEDGPFGTELHGKLPGDGGGALVPVRFVGVDGPRWFLRAMFVGAVATDEKKAAQLEDALREVVVVRGTEPIPAREAVPLTLPREISEQVEAAQAGDEDGDGSGAGG